MKRRVALEIHREDHKIDALGRIFLGATERDETLALLRGYLGPQATLRHVELDDAVLRVEADVREFAAKHDDFSAIMLKALADRLAEAFAEHLHQHVGMGEEGDAHRGEY